MEHIEEIKFVNDNRPESFFDIVNIEELYQREDLDHDFTNHHRVNFYGILFVQEGKGQHTVDFTTYDIKKGSLLMLRKNQTHAFSTRSDIKGKILLFTEEFLVSQYNHSEIAKTILLFNELISEPLVNLDEAHIDATNKLINYIKQEMDKADEYSDSLIRSSLHILTTKVSRIKRSRSLSQKKYLKEFIQLQQFIEDNIFTTRKAKDYALMMNCSTKTLNNITKAILGKSVKEVIDEIATLHIKRLLIESELSVNEVAYKAGFEEPTNFFKYFKHQTGLTPEVFRNKAV